MLKNPQAWKTNAREKGDNMPKEDTQFGGKRANPRGNPSVAVAQREFYRWVETQATEKEIREYVNDTNKPMIRRRFIQVFLQAESVRDFCEVTDQTHGKPNQKIQIEAPPKITFIAE